VQQDNMLTANLEENARVVRRNCTWIGGGGTDIRVFWTHKMRKLS